MKKAVTIISAILFLIGLIISIMGIISPKLYVNTTISNATIIQGLEVINANLLSTNQISLGIILVLVALGIKVYLNKEY